MTLQPLSEVQIGRGWRVDGDPAYNDPNTHIDVESDLMQGGRNGKSVIIVSAHSDLWDGESMPVGLSLEGAVALIIALEREIALDPMDEQEAARIKARLSGADTTE